MSDNYLWDKSGRDREVEALEDLLSPLAHKGGVPAKRRSWEWGAALVALASAAAILLALRLSLPRELPAGPAPVVAARDIDLGKYGTVHAHEGALIRFVERSDSQIRMRLERGTIDAAISGSARPGFFQVDTPATRCVDLGCHYTLTVEPDGSTFVHVDFGQVAFVNDGRETWVPDGASCHAWPGRGSGTPRWDDASQEVIEAVEALDRATGQQRQAEMRRLVDVCSREREALTLWHLAHDPDQYVSEFAWAALESLVGTPKGIQSPRSPGAESRWKEHFWFHWTMGARGKD